MFNKYLVLSNPLGYLTFDIRALNYNKLLVITGYINISNNSGLIKAGVIGKFSGIFMGQQKYITIDAVGINGVIKNVGFLQGDEIVLNQNLESGTYGGAVYIRSSGVII
ncbi:hypothetical protein [Cetobacterium sp.]|uniref:hypothetical protein n=1 Tax=Cetobacterium sp. TaxID=2071632 RepID=UPI003F36112A